MKDLHRRSSFLKPGLSFSGVRIHALNRFFFQKLICVVCCNWTKTMYICIAFDIFCFKWSCLLHR